MCRLFLKLKYCIVIKEVCYSSFCLTTFVLVFRPTVSIYRLFILFSTSWSNYWSYRLLYFQTVIVHTSFYSKFNSKQYRSPYHLTSLVELFITNHSRLLRLLYVWDTGSLRGGPINGVPTSTHGPMCLLRRVSSWQSNCRSVTFFGFTNDCNPT